jgi:hypothetical protein
LLTRSAADGSDGSGAPTAARVYTAPKADIDKIRDEGMNRSQVMQTLSYLTTSSAGV